MTSRPYGSDDLRLRGAGFKSDGIVCCILQALLAAQVALSSFDGNVSEEKLDLFEFTSGLMTEASPRSTQIMWSKPCQAAARSSLSNDRPNHLWRKSISPRPACFVDGSEQPTCSVGEISRWKRGRKSGGSTG